MSSRLTPSTVKPSPAWRVLEALEAGRLVAARLAPRGPEVDQHPLAAVVGEARRLPPSSSVGRARSSGAGSPTASASSPLLEQAEAEQADAPRGRAMKAAKALALIAGRA